MGLSQGAVSADVSRGEYWLGFGTRRCRINQVWRFIRWRNVYLQLRFLPCPSQISQDPTHWKFLVGMMLRSPALLGGQEGNSGISSNTKLWQTSAKRVGGIFSMGENGKRSRQEFGETLGENELQKEQMAQLPVRGKL